MAAIERLMNRKVESRVIAGFEPGTASREPRQPEEPRQPRQHQQRHQQGRGNRGQGRNSQPRSNGNGQQRSHGQPRPDGQQRFNGQRRGARPGYAAAAALPAEIAKEREAQIQEARARMAAEGEKPAAPAPKRGRYEPTLGAHLGPKRED